MLREKWEFSYTAEQLAEATAKKLAFHQERLVWWKEKRLAVMATIRSEGLEINEKIALEYRSPKSSDWNNSSQVVIRNDLKNALQECQEKLAHHTSKIQDYSGWHQMLTANPQTQQSLDVEDWLFFFSGDDITTQSRMAVL